MSGSWHHIIVAVEGQPSPFTEAIVEAIRETVAETYAQRVLIQRVGPDGGILQDIQRGTEEPIVGMDVTPT